MKITTGLITAGLIVTAASAKVHAVEWMSGTELIGHCKDYTEHPTSLDGVACASYVQGFLGGAEATDGVVADTIRSRLDDRSSFEQRVINTRIGRRLQQFGATAFANYCLPKDVPNTEVVINVINYIVTHPESKDMTAQDLVYSALKEHYPCD